MSHSPKAPVYCAHEGVGHVASLAGCLAASLAPIHLMLTALLYGCWGLNSGFHAF